MSDKPLTVGFAGLTHLGIVSSAGAAAAGATVIACDHDLTLVAALKQGELPVHEPGLAELVKEHGARLSYTATAADLGRCDLVYICPDVPTDDKGNSDLAALQPLIEDVAAASRKDAVLVILSQVPPGFTRKNAPKDRQVYYQVETLIFGAAVERTTKPERFIVGCADPAQPLAPALARYLGLYGCPVLPMRYESAELAKITINMFLVSSVSTTNTVAELCEKVGADWAEIAPAMKLDRRIGPHAYLAPGLGIAGGNLERDLTTVQQLAEQHGTDAGVVAAWRSNSQRRRDWVLMKLEELVLKRQPDARLGLLGLAYKQDTKSTKNSPALALLKALPKLKIRAFDPQVAADPAFHAGLEGAADALDACAGADALIVMTPWPDFRTLDPAAIAEQLRGKLVIDPYGVLDAAGCKRAGLSQHVLGRAPR